MAVSIGAFSAWKGTPSWSIGASGVWKSILNMWVGAGGVWKAFYSALSAIAAGTAPLNKSANLSSITSNNITATPSGGSGSYSYAWEIVSEDDPDGTPIINNSSSQTCTVTTQHPPASQLTITVSVRCLVTDTVTGATAYTSNNITIQHSHDNGV